MQFSSNGGPIRKVGVGVVCYIFIWNALNLKFPFFPQDKNPESMCKLRAKIAKVGQLQNCVTVL